MVNQILNLNIKFWRQFISCLVILTLVLSNFSFVQAETATDLQKDLIEKQKRIEELKKEAASYEASLRQKQRESITFSNQISILSDRISKTQVEIEETKIQIEAASLEIKQQEEGISQAENNIDTYKESLGSLLRWLERYQNKSIVQIFFTYPSFAEFYREIHTLKTAQVEVNNLVEKVVKVKADLETAKGLLEKKRVELESAAKTLSQQQLSLETKQEEKQYLLQETRSSEKRFAALMTEAKREAEETNREIETIERLVREKLKAEGIQTNGEGPAFIWPVSNTRGISTGFHDSDYPFRRLFEHSGIDIRAYQGTPVRAAASGYVARVQTGGAKGYGFIMLIHSGGLASVYGHVSKIHVEQDSFVAAGQVIASSGGMPGTRGAGPFSTGPHLHFEIRLNGIPVNPMPYLP